MSSRFLTYCMLRWRNGSILCHGRNSLSFQGCLSKRFQSNVSEHTPAKPARKKRTNKKTYTTEVIKVEGGAASLSRKRVGKLDPVRWPGIGTNGATSAESASSLTTSSGATCAAPLAPPSISSIKSHVLELGCFDTAEDHDDVGTGFLPLSEDAGLSMTGSAQPTTDSSSKKGKLKKKQADRPLTPKDREELSQAKTSDLVEASKRSSFVISLLSFLQVCVGNGLTGRAYDTLQYYRDLDRSGRDSSLRGADVRLYNVLLESYAKKGSLDRCQEVWQMALTDGISPSADSYVFLLECIARGGQTPEMRRLVTHYLDTMAAEGVKLGDATISSAASRKEALRALEWAEPRRRHDGTSRGVNEETAASPWTPPPRHYNCTLLNHFNQDIDAPQSVDSPLAGVRGDLQLSQLAAEQLACEIAGTVTVPSVYHLSELQQKSLKSSSKVMERLERDWRRQLTAGFLRDLAPIQRHNEPSPTTDACAVDSDASKTAGGGAAATSRYISLYPYLMGMPVSEYVQLMLNEVSMHMSGTVNPNSGKGALYRRLGELAMKRHYLHMRRSEGQVDRLFQAYKSYLQWLDADQCQGFLSRLAWRRIAEQLFPDEDLEPREQSWPPVVVVSVGRFLYRLIVNDVQIDPSITQLARFVDHPIPAFYTVFHQDGTRCREVIRPHPALVRVFTNSRQNSITMEATMVPMVAPPLPWTSARSGGYLVSASPLVRIKTPAGSSVQLRRLRDTPVQQLYPVLDSLNQLGSIPWRINQPVLDVVLQLFRDKGCPELDLPAPPDESVPHLPPIDKNLSRVEQYRATRERALVNRLRHDHNSLWCNANYKISLASHYRDRVIWLPHTLDFRGRVYPYPPHLSHVGSDLSRSLLMFARSMPLGLSGLNWLKTHLVNLTGKKKHESNSVRLQYCDQILDDVQDSADKPLTGRGWWRSSEDPWQTLAACIELTAALRHPDGPTNYCSHLPVHQDGSCNGLQHYAALGRDTAGAGSVNLAPSPRPSDIYSHVATLVEQRRALDAQSGLPIAKALEGFVRRKVIKQTVMTTVYGVTMYGARLQIAKQLNDIDGFPKDDVWMGSHYLVTKTFSSLQQMFSSAKVIQEWLVECARVLAVYRCAAVEWTTPLGLPVVQPYFRNYSSSAPLSATGNITRPHFYQEAYDRPNVMKQRNAFPPNYIHSLDSTHMMLTSLHCQRLGIPYISVHDCYWTHAACVDRMNAICRQQFVALHSQPLLEQLSDGMLQRFGYPADQLPSTKLPEAGGSTAQTAKAIVNTSLANVPDKGDFDLAQVLGSEYFFS